MADRKFSQPEVLVGYLQELKVDTQGPYLATIKLTNGAVVEASLPKELVGQIENDKTDLLSCTKLVELSGNASYRSEGLSMILDLSKSTSVSPLMIYFSTWRIWISRPSSNLRTVTRLA